MNPVGLIYFVLAVIALIVVWAYARCFFKRLTCMVKLRRACRKYGLRLEARPLWFLGSRYSKRCDLVIRGAKASFAVKLFGCLWPLKSLILREYGEYFFRAHTAFLMVIMDVFDGYPHTLPAYRFPPEDGLRPILLINPMPLEIRLQPSNGLEQVSGTGDTICNMEIANLSHLLRLMENAA